MIDYNAFAAEYDEHYVRPIDRAEDAALGAFIGDATGLDVLDVACGTGNLLDLLPGQPDDYLGLDLSRGMLDVAERKHPNRAFIQWDAQETYPVPSASFDLAVCLFAYHLFPEPGQALGNMRRVLRTGGRCIVLAYTDAYQEREHSSDPPGTYHTTTLPELETSLALAGFLTHSVTHFREQPDSAYNGSQDETELARLFLREALIPSWTARPYCLIGTGVR